MAKQEMPTAAKLVAAVSFAVVTYLASQIYIGFIPEGTRIGLFLPLNTLIGALCGWMVAGRLAGSGSLAAIGSGIRTVATMLFFVLLLWSLYEMLQRSMDMRYKGPAEALEGMFELIAEYFMLGAGSVELLIVLLVGGILAALLTEAAARRFK